MCPSISSLDQSLVNSLNSLEVKYSSFRCLYGGNCIYSAMNIGILASNSHYLFFCGDTDMPYLNSLYHSSLRPSADSLTPYSGHSIIIGRCVSSTTSYTPFFNSFSIFSLIIERNPLHHQALLYSRSLFASFGLYDSSFKIIADYVFNLKLRSLYFRSLSSSYRRISLLSTNSIFCYFAEGGRSSTPKLRNYIELANAKAPYLPCLYRPFSYIFSFCIFVAKNISRILF